LARRARVVDRWKPSRKKRGETLDDEPSIAARPLSREELRQLEERARVRWADPEYRLRIGETDRMSRQLVEELER